MKHVHPTDSQSPLTHSDIELVCRIVILLLYGVDHRMNPLEIPRWLSKGLDVDEGRILALANRLDEWAETEVE